MNDRFTPQEFHERIRAMAIGKTYKPEGQKQPKTEFPKPVQILTCYVCHGDGYVERGGITQRCVNCYGRGRVTTEGGEV